MKKAKKKGKSYSQGWFERQSRRFMSVLLCSIEHKRGKYSRICSCHIRRRG